MMEQPFLFPELAQPVPVRDEALIIEAEKWISRHLGPTPYRIGWRCTWAAYAFRYWLLELGVAIDFTTDDRRELNEDERRWRKSGVVTLRVEPFDDAAGRALVAFLAAVEPWEDRKGSGIHRSLTLAQYVLR